MARMTLSPRDTANAMPAVEFEGPDAPAAWSEFGLHLGELLTGTSGAEVTITQVSDQGRDPGSAEFTVWIVDNDGADVYTLLIEG